MSITSEFLTQEFGCNRWVAQARSLLERKREESLLTHLNGHTLACKSMSGQRPSNGCHRLALSACVGKESSCNDPASLQCRPRATPTRSVTQWRIHPGLMLMVQYCSWKLRGQVARDEFLRMRKPKSPETALHCKSQKNSNLSAKLPLPRDNM
jgi:hypothetical protein